MDWQELLGHWNQPSVVAGYQLRLAPNERMRVNLVRSYHKIACPAQKDMGGRRADPLVQVVAVAVD